MKTFLNCLVVLFLVSSCSKVEINDDSIIGIWENSIKSGSDTEKLAMDTEEWIFNDAYLGRYHGYSDEEIVFLTDFKWTVDGNVYTLSYPGTDLPDDQVVLVTNENGSHLEKLTGGRFAEKLN